MKYANPLFSGLLPLVLAQAACGSHHGGGSGGTKPTPAPGDVKPTASETYVIDAESLPSSGGELTYGGQPLLWSFALTVDGEARTAKTNVEFAVVRAELEHQPVKGSSQVSLELTLRSSSEQLLATNLKAQADKTPVTSAMWQDACTAVSPSLSILDGATVVEKGDTKHLKVVLKLCDFAQVLVAPTVSVVPVQVKEDPRNVVWECAATNYTGFHSIGKVLYSGDPYYGTCHAGYTTPSVGTVVTSDPLKDESGNDKALAIPKGFLNEPFQYAASNDFLDYLANGGAAKRYKLSSDDFDGLAKGTLPFGLMRDCHTLEVELLYKDAPSAASGTVKAARLTFQRTYDSTAGGLTWVADDQTAMPTPNEVYAGNQATIRYWLHCAWQNPLGADVVTLAPVN